MKKIKIFSILLSLILIVSCFPQYAFAAETETQEETEPTTIPVSEMPFGTVCIQNGCHTIEGMKPLAGSDKLLDTAQSAFLFETNTQTVVYSYNPDQKVAPGSLAKLVNAAVALEYCKLDDVVTLTADINRRPSGSRHYDFKNEEEVTVETLIYSMIHWGANDAAIGLADYVAGNQMGFTNLMNEWVKKIGCTSTEFGNVHGLSSATSTTTARDMAKILIAAMENEQLKEILSAMSYEAPPTNKHDAKRSFRTINYMIDKGTIEDFYDTRVKGGVTSYVEEYGASIAVWANDVDDRFDTKETEATEASGETTEAAEDPTASKNKHYVAVIMNASRTFDPNQTWKAVYYGNFNEMTKLIRVGFGNYKVNRIVYDGMALDQMAVNGGECNVIGEARVNIDSVVPANAHMDNIYKIFTAKDGLKAPIKAGDLIGTMQLTYRDSVLAEAEVYAMGSVTAAGKNGISIRSTATRSDAGGNGIWSTIGTIAVVLLALAVLYLTFNAYMKARIRARRRQQRANRRRTR